MNRFIAKIVGRPNGGGGRSTPHEERRPVVTRAESAPCTCTDACERDHEND
jgi:hypothetical protein